MNKRQAAQVDQWAAQDAAGSPECLLCGATTPVFTDPDWFCVLHGEGCEEDPPLASFDLCGRCNSAFAALARDLERAAERRAARLEVVEQVAGQLELDQS